MQMTSQPTGEDLPQIRSSEPLANTRRCDPRSLPLGGLTVSVQDSQGRRDGRVSAPARRAGFARRRRLASSYLDRGRAARRWSRRCAFCRDSSRRWVSTCSGWVTAQRSGSKRSNCSGLASAESCRITSCKYAQGSSRCRFAPAMIVQSTAARGPAEALPKNIQFFRLCRARHKPELCPPADYAEFTCAGTQSVGPASEVAPHNLVTALGGIEAAHRPFGSVANGSEFP
jgi:hypothetical protein